MDPITAKSTAILRVICEIRDKDGNIREKTVDETPIEVIMIQGGAGQ